MVAVMFINAFARRGRRDDASFFSLVGSIVLWGLLFSCQPTAPAVDHLAVAHRLADEIQARTGKVDYADAEYERVAEELQMIPEGSPDYDEARSWLKDIQSARRRALFAEHIQEGGSFPEKQAKKAARKGGASAKRTTSTKHRGRPAGWNPYSADVDLAGIEARVRGGLPASSSIRGGQGAGASSSHASSISGGVPITIYTASWCGVCKSAKRYMRKHGIAFVEKDVEKSAAAAREMAAKTGGRTSSVPVIDVGGQIMVGFSPEALEQMIAKAQR